MSFSLIEINTVYDDDDEGQFINSNNSQEDSAIHHNAPKSQGQKKVRKTEEEMRMERRNKGNRSTTKCYATNGKNNTGAVS